MPWQLLGSFAPDELPHTREQLHCVIQVVASVPRLLVPNPKDGSYTHSAFTWDRQRHAIVSAEVPSDVRFHVGIRPADATVFLLDTSGNEIATQSADGMAIETLFRWLTRQIVESHRLRAAAPAHGR
ncbi:MAG: hypothetical protein O3A10_00440 [Chloroflexi bacterium]|nr:hypothetical protein [Chloroflexota bacterium]MDA1145425.1 hypothetical protein [Chloroflexota bacterium]